MRRLLGILIVTVAVLIYCYPTISSLYNSFLALRTISKTTDNAITETDRKTELEKCNIYNNSLNRGVTVVNEKMSVKNDTYESLLDLGSGVMGYIEIPCISQKLPIYHYTDDEELAKGIGHIASSSLPVGGNGTNCVLTGHRGLPNNLLFTRLDEVEEGDMVYVSTLNETKAYKVYDIKTVLPEETGDIIIEEGKDLLTLITCTPYGVNTHRLVIWCERTEFNEDKYEPVSDFKAMIRAIPLTRFYVSAGFITALVVLMKVMNKRGKKNEGKAAT